MTETTFARLLPDKMVNCPKPSLEAVYLKSYSQKMKYASYPSKVYQGY